MHKWIQHVEKPLGHLDYTNLTTQICRSNHSSPNFEQNQIKKITKKQQKGRMFKLLIIDALALLYCNWLVKII
jgi:hypothetical protein